MSDDELREKICSAVAKRLKEERVRQGLSLNLLAARAGLSRQTVTFIEQEERKPTLDTLLRLTGALGVSLETWLAEARRDTGC